MKSLTLDMVDAKGIARFGEQFKRDYPALNAVILNAGIMRTESIDDGNASDAEETIATNLLGPIRLARIAAACPAGAAARDRHDRLSGLAFVPLAMTPMYRAPWPQVRATLSAYRNEDGRQVTKGQSGDRTFVTMARD